MPLSCFCDEPDDASYYYQRPDAYTMMPSRQRRVRCASCKTLIDSYALCTEFARYRHPRSDVELDIYGEGGEIWMASMWHCERCADLWFSLFELGFKCVAPDENVLDLVREYAELRSLAPRE